MDSVSYACGNQDGYILCGSRQISLKLKSSNVDITSTIYQGLSLGATTTFASLSNTNTITLTPPLNSASST